MKVDGVLI